MTGLLGYRCPLLSSRQSLDRSVGLWFPHGSLCQSQLRSSRSVSKLEHLGWDRSRRGSHSYRQLMQCNSNGRDGADSHVSKPSGQDLLIVGPGVLGSYVGMLWQQQYSSANVVGQTNSTTNHDRLRQMKIEPRTKEGSNDRKFPYVLFSAPPSGSADYPAEVAEAAELWDGTGALVFSSSAGLYEVDDGSHCNEDCKIADRGKSERTDKLLGAEDAILKAGGIVIRLVGLYHAGRGAHTFFLRQGQVARWGGYTVNLIHYEDAASLCVAALQSGTECQGRVFVGADGSPLTFEEMIDACLTSDKFSGSVDFTGQESSKKGKIMSNCQTREALDWQPKYFSFEDFMASGANDFYNTSPLYSAKPAA